MSDNAEDFSTHPLNDCAQAIDLLRRINEQAKSLPSKLVPHYAQDSGMWTTDFLVFAAARRTMSLAAAFLSMMRERNFGVAAALLRMQLDTALRFSGLRHVKDRQGYARAMLAGEQVSKMKAVSGDRLTDKFLSEALSEQLPWVRKVYVETSGFIHLSERHIFQSIATLREEDRMAYFSISAEDVKRPSSDYLEILMAFDNTTTLICSLVLSWAETRPSANVASAANS